MTIQSHQFSLVPRDGLPRSSRFPLGGSAEPVLSGLGLVAGKGQIQGMGPSVAGYSPIYAATLAEGTLGSQIGSANEVELDNSSDIYTNAFGSPFSPTGLAASIRHTAGSTYFGGRLKTLNRSCAPGETLWFRAYHYFPADFCWRAGNDPSDFWGNTKWIRLEWTTGSSLAGRATYQLGGVSQLTCNNSPLHGLVTREYNGAGNIDISPRASVPRDQWVSLQFAIHLQPDNTGWVRFWLDNTFNGEVTGVSTLPSESGSRILEFVMLGDYINGSAYETGDFGFAEVILSFETPDTTDSGERPFIDPDVSASSFT
jgi:hypothetical protein